MSRGLCAEDEGLEPPSPKDGGFQDRCITNYASPPSVKKPDSLHLIFIKINDYLNGIGHYSVFL